MYAGEEYSGESAGKRTTGYYDVMNRIYCVMAGSDCIWQDCHGACLSICHVS